MTAEQLRPKALNSWQARKQPNNSPSVPFNNRGPLTSSSQNQTSSLVSSGSLPNQRSQTSSGSTLDSSITPNAADTALEYFKSFRGAQSTRSRKILPPTTKSPLHPLHPSPQLQQDDSAHTPTSIPANQEAPKQVLAPLPRTPSPLPPSRQNQPVHTLSSTSTPQESLRVRLYKGSTQVEDGYQKAKISSTIPPHSDPNALVTLGIKRTSDGIVKGAEPPPRPSGASNSQSTAISSSVLKPQPIPAAPDVLLEKTIRLVNAYQSEAQTREPGSKNWLPLEKQLLLHLKDERHLDWEVIYHTYFRHRGNIATLRTQHWELIKKGLSASSIPTRIEPASRPLLQRCESGKRKYKEDRSDSIYSEGDPDQEFQPRKRPPRVFASEEWKTTARTSRQKATPTVINPDLLFQSHEQQVMPETPIIRKRIVRDKDYAEDEICRNKAALSSITGRVTRSPAEATSKPTKRTSMHISRPYLSSTERHFLKKSVENGSAWDESESYGWDGVILHVDFTDEECDMLEPSVCSVVGRLISNPLTSERGRITELMKGATGEEVEQIARRAVWSGGSINRTVDSIASFLIDILYPQALTPTQSLQKLKSHPNYGSFTSPLRRRELGADREYQLSLTTRTRLWESLGPARIFRGASSDVNTVKWAPNGELFAASAFALSDDHSMQYNRPNTLLFGDITKSDILELPSHVIERKAATGINASRNMRVSQEPYLFTSVTGAEFSPDSQVLLTAGYDNYVRVWEVGKQDSSYKIDCGNKVDALSVTTSGLFAAASQNLDSAIRICQYELDGSHLTRCRKIAKLSLQHAKDLKGSHQLLPCCVRWAPGRIQERYLLGGFSSKSDEERRGEACLYDVEAGALIGHSIGKRNVFDIAWSPSIFGRFAIACTPGSNVNKGTRSVVRIHDSRWLPTQGYMRSNQQSTLEFECLAWDMNDVVFNANDDNIISAGCTDGTTYVWDTRRPDLLLHRFTHGKPLIELDTTQARERVDPGVRFLSWGNSGRHLFTGSSDGIVASWNPYRSPQDAFKKEIVQLDSGVMAGSFSPDYSNLLLGDVQGSVVLLSVGQENTTLQKCKEFNFITAEEKKARLRNEFQKDDIPDEEETGRSCATKLLKEERMVIKPFGDFPKRQAVQGPSYNGPYDSGKGASQLRSDASKFQSKAKRTESDVTTTKAKKSESIVMPKDFGDSGAWKHRIPDRIRDMQAEKKTLCLQCFRCQQPLSSGLSFSASSDELVCLECRKAWTMDILGYNIAKLEALELGDSINTRKEPKQTTDDSSPRGLSRSTTGTENSSQRSQLAKEKRKRKKVSIKPMQVPEYYHDLWEIDWVALAQQRALK